MGESEKLAISLAGTMGISSAHSPQQTLPATPVRMLPSLRARCGSGLGRRPLGPATSMLVETSKRLPAFSLLRGGDGSWMHRALLAVILLFRPWQTHTVRWHGFCASSPSTSCLYHSLVSFFDSAHVVPASHPTLTPPLNILSLGRQPRPSSPPPNSPLLDFFKLVPNVCGPVIPRPAIVSRTHRHGRRRCCSAP
jgi:hypothetical protein